MSIPEVGSPPPFMFAPRQTCKAPKVFSNSANQVRRPRRTCRRSIWSNRSRDCWCCFLPICGTARCRSRQSRKGSPAPSISCVGARRRKLYFPVLLCHAAQKTKNKGRIHETPGDRQSFDRFLELAFGCAGPGRYFPEIPIRSQMAASHAQWLLLRPDRGTDGRNSHWAWL